MLSIETIDKTLRELEQFPANAANWEPRKFLFEKLDAQFSSPASENDPALGEFYRRRCRRAIAEIRAWNRPAARLWKFYSSGVVVKDADGKVYAFDLNDGCTPGERRCRFLIDTALAEEFAGLIDTAFYTHRHLDHIGLAIADALLARGKEVVAPDEAIHAWLLRGATSAEHCRRPGLVSYAGLQRGGVSGDIPNAAYLVSFAPGVTLFVRGDIYRGEDLLPILDRMEAEHRTVDYAATSPFSQSGPDPVLELYRRFHCSFIPIHEWEFSHRRMEAGGPATQTYEGLYESFRIPGSEGKCMILGWGESMTLLSATEKQLKHLSRDKETA